MHLKISAPGGVLFDGNIDKVTIPTYAGEITVLPGHQPLTSIVKAGIVSFQSSDDVSQEFIVADGKVQLSVSKGTLLVDGETVLITTSAATSSPVHTQEVLEKMKVDMEAELATIKEAGNTQELEKALENMDKIQADIQLVKLKNIG